MRRVLIGTLRSDLVMTTIFLDRYSVNFKNLSHYFFFFQAEDGIRDYKVTGVQTCALPISHRRRGHRHTRQRRGRRVCERLRVPGLQGRPDVLGAAGGARAGGADHAPPRADTRRALASSTPAGAPGGLRQGLERLTMQRARTLAVITATMVLMSAAHADAPAGNDHAAPRVPASVAEWARGASLFQGLGDFHRAVTTSVPLAQQYFDQGMRLLWAFNHDESTRSFAKAAELDPACAACYWGVALTVGPNYNLPAMAETRARVAWEALHEAQERAPQVSAVEQALIGALAARYPAPQPPAAAEPDALLSAYAAAMRNVAERFPDDLDVQTLCAESEMNVHAWKLWSEIGRATV